MGSEISFERPFDVFFREEAVAKVERCAHCILPRHLDFLSFSDDGVCNLCRAAEQSLKEVGRKESSEEKLNEIIEKIRERGKGKQYDCLVGLSGGQDSSYLVYLLTQKHKLRVLTTYYRTPFTPDVIDENVRRIVKKLDLKLVEIKIPWDQHLDAARRYFLLWQKKPLAEIANLTCIVCKLVNREVFRVARTYNIKSVVCGGNRYEELQLLPAFSAEDVTAEAHTFWNQSRKMFKTLKKGMSVVFKCLPVIRYLPLSVKVSLFYITLHSPYLRLRYSDIDCVDYFFHADWREKDCVETIQSKLGWQLPTGCIGTWKADCDFADIKNYMFYKTTGASYADAMLSNMIRDGQITREKALKLLEGNRGISRVRLKRALNTLGLSFMIGDNDR
jgi:hypothetical protein